MPYKNLSDLPEAVRKETSHKVAWNAVKQGGYEKGDDEKWHRKD